MGKQSRENRERRERESSATPGERLVVTCTAFAVLHDGGRKWAPVKLQIVEGEVRSYELVSLDVQDYPTPAYQHLAGAVMDDVARAVENVVASRKCEHPPAADTAPVGARMVEMCELCGAGRYRGHEGWRMREVAHA